MVMPDRIEDMSIENVCVAKIHVSIECFASEEAPVVVRS